MRTARLSTWTLTLVGAAGGVALASACNTIIGNGDIQVSTDSGSDGSLAHVVALVRDASADDQGAVDGAFGMADAPDVHDATDGADAVPEVGSDATFVCEAGTKSCGGGCVSLDDPGYGCGSKGCTPCELPNAIAGCAAGGAGSDGGAGSEGGAGVDAGSEGGAGVDAGPEGGTLVCSVAVCKGTHLDCNGLARDGCEVDPSDDLYNCGACGIDCSNLPHVAGNVSCVASACSFDDSSCAPGYGICTSDPRNGCDTVISEPAHCGGCTTTCPAGAPYCSPTGSTPAGFACTSGCSAGLSLCNGSCVDETTDAKHCGGCNTQCPSVTGGTATCSGSPPSCGFVCNANDHLCGSGTSATCAANNDANNCGIGASCGACSGPANSTTSCSGGTTCNYTCNAGAHACGSACPLDTDPDNCGALCGTNCPGPTSGAGSAACNGNDCAIVCSAGQHLCGTECVDWTTDEANCGSCGKTCSSTQACVGGKCVCDAQSCPNGCCDSNQVCQPSACGTAGAACAVGCPATVAETNDLVLWLVADTYDAGAPVWSDQSGQHADANCSSCPTTLTTLNGHLAVSFTGGSYFTLSDPSSDYDSQNWTAFVVAAPDPSAPSNAQILALSNGVDSIALQRSAGATDLSLMVVPGSATNSVTATGAWAGTWEQITAGVDSTQNGFITVGGMTSSASVGAPALVDYSSSYLGTDPASQMQTYIGQIAEVIVFRTTSLSSASSIESYLSTRYALP